MVLPSCPPGNAEWRNATEKPPAGRTFLPEGETTKCAFLS